MKIGIIGAGRLGITFALLCEKSGFDVLVSDIRSDYVENLNEKKCSTNEPHVQELLLKSKNFSATTNNIEVIKNCEIIFTFVSTPSTTEGNYDISSVMKVVEEFKLALKLNVNLKNKKFVVGCTTNPGDTDLIQSILDELGVRVAYNPEFIAQGEIVKGLEESDIVLIGTNHIEVSESLIKIYEKIQTTKINPCIMSPKAAELTKIAINCFLTTKISFANMMGDILLKSNLENEINIVLNAIAGDTRIGKKYMKYGFGFGGPCLPRDNRALGHYASKIGMNLNIPLTVDNFNKEHSFFLKNYYMSINPDKNIPFVMDSLAYKKGTDILEESQQLKLCIDLLEEGYTINVIEIDSIIAQLKDLTQLNNLKINFFKPNSNPYGVKINL